MNLTTIGSHCVLELTGCPFELLDNETHLRDALSEASASSLSSLLKITSHKFEPHGVTALGLSAGSHISIHTRPELGYAACDIFACAPGVNPQEACEVLAKRLGATGKSLKVLPRGRRVEASRPVAAKSSPSSHPVLSAAR